MEKIALRDLTEDDIELRCETTKVHVLGEDGRRGRISVYASWRLPGTRTSHSSHLVAMASLLCSEGEITRMAEASLPILRREALRGLNEKVRDYISAFRDVEEYLSTQKDSLCAG